MITPTKIKKIYHLQGCYSFTLYLMERKEFVASSPMIKLDGRSTLVMISYLGTFDRLLVWSVTSGCEWLCPKMLVNYPWIWSQPHPQHMYSPQQPKYSDHRLVTRINTHKHLLLPFSCLCPDFFLTCAMSLFWPVLCICPGLWAAITFPCSTLVQLCLAISCLCLVFAFQTWNFKSPSALSAPSRFATVRIVSKSTRISFLLTKNLYKLVCSINGSTTTTFFLVFLFLLNFDSFRSGLIVRSWTSPSPRDWRNSWASARARRLATRNLLHFWCLGALGNFCWAADFWWWDVFLAILHARRTPLDHQSGRNMERLFPSAVSICL